MKKYIILSIALLAGISFTAYAQDEDSGSEATEESDDSGVLGHKAGDITGAILFGRGSYLNASSVPQAPRNNTNWTVPGQVPYANVSANGGSASNMIGGEGRYFITDIIAVTLSGGAIMQNNPALQNVQYFYIDPNSGTGLTVGNDPSTSNQTWVPHYGSVVSDNRIQANVNVGGEYHFPSARFKRLFPYLGANFNYYYSRQSVYDPTVNYQTNTNGTGGTDVLIYDIGVRTAEIQGMGGQMVAGIDVYVAPGIFLGLSTRPVSYLYTWNTKIPAPGLESLQAEAHTWSLFTQTYFKIGFIIGDL